MENALSELKETSTAEVSGDHYYRFEQNYEGILYMEEQSWLQWIRMEMWHR